MSDQGTGFRYTHWLYHFVFWPPTLVNNDYINNHVTSPQLKVARKPFVCDRRRAITIKIV